MSRFLGSFEMLEGGYIENICSLFSGGIHDTYYLQIANKLTFNTPITCKFSATQYNHEISMNNLAALANVEEIFHILETAIAQNNIINAHTQNSIAQTQHDILINHMYSLTDVLVSRVDKTRFVKMQNPHNRPLQIKRWRVFADLLSK